MLIIKFFILFYMLSVVHPRLIFRAIVIPVDLGLSVPIAGILPDPSRCSQQSNPPF